MSSGTLETGETHPSAHSAMAYVLSQIGSLGFGYTREALASNALSGNRTCEVCFETLERIITGLPISDRYLLGLAWFLKELEEERGSNES